MGNQGCFQRGLLVYGESDTFCSPDEEHFQVLRRLITENGKMECKCAAALDEKLFNVK